MFRRIRTRRVSSDYAESDPIELQASKTTRTMFTPGLTPSGVRGTIVRQKADGQGGFIDQNEVNFNAMPPDCGVRIDLSSDAVRCLYDRLSELYLVQEGGVTSGESIHLVGSAPGELAHSPGLRDRVINALLEAGYSEEVWNEIASAAPELATRLAEGQIVRNRRQALVQFREALITESSNEAFWQGFLLENPWLLELAFVGPVFVLQGETYVGGKLARGRQGIGGVATDYLLRNPSTKSFSVVEIKTPDMQLVGSIYRGTVKGEEGPDVQLDNQIYSPSTELGGSIVQTRNQMIVAVRDFPGVVGRTFDEIENASHPHGLLVAGSLAPLSERERHSFNLIRRGYADMDIITFDEIFSRAASFLDFAEPVQPDSGKS